MNPILITELFRISERQRLHEVELARRARLRREPRARIVRGASTRARRLARVA